MAKGNNCEVKFRIEFALIEFGKFSCSHPVLYWNVVEGDKLSFAVAEWPCHLLSTQRINAVKNDELYPRFLCGFHCEPHGGKVGIEATADILHVEDKGIDLAEVLRAWFTPILSCVEAVHRQACLFIKTIFDPAVPRAPDSVFGTEKGHQLHTGGIVQQVNCSLPIPVYSRWICDQTRLEAGQSSKIACSKDVDSAENVANGVLNVRSGGPLLFSCEFLQSVGDS